ncbi:MAG: LCP family protein [Chloroflexota bacterium]|nr:LCP family protein [Chloroflexota bacterium]
MLSTSAALASLCSALLPGLGQVYQNRWIRGLVALGLPLVVLGAAGATVAIVDPLTALVIRYATIVDLVVVGALFLYHLFVVGDAFRGPSNAARTAVDYAVLGAVVLALCGLYAVVYRESSAWAALAGQVFRPIAQQADTRPSSAPAAPSPAEFTGTERLNVLVMGLDVRPGSRPTETLNTDTVIVLSLDPVNKTAAMLSIPRDLYVDLPGQGQDKINAAYAIGGPELSRRAVENLLGIPIQSYAIVDFVAFTRIIDTLGGVVVDVQRPIRDEAYPTADFGIERLNILAGPQLMDGARALRFARSRHDSNDFGRAKRQQEVILAFRTRVVQGNMLFRLPAILDQVGTAVETNFDPANIITVARFGSGLDQGAIRSEVLVPCGGAEPRCELKEQIDENGYFLFPDKPKVRDLVAEVFYDPKVRQEGAKVEVRGAGARSGVAASVADRLESRAFVILSVTNGAPARSAVLLRNASKRSTATALAQQLGLQVADAPAAETSTADVVVLIGADFRGLATDLQK